MSHAGSVLPVEREHRECEILEDITIGRGTPEHITLLEELAHTVKDTTMCALGQSAPNPVLSTLKYFREEYERHIQDKRCDAFVCKQLVGAPCQSACPVDTEPWRYIALVEKGDYTGAYRVIRSANPFPGQFQGVTVNAKPLYSAPAGRASITAP